MRFRPIVASSGALLLLLLLVAHAHAHARWGSPPVCIHGGPYQAECTGPITTVLLDGGASFDTDGTPPSFYWFGECPFGTFDDPTSASPSFLVDNSGECGRQCGIVLRVTSGGDTTACRTTVTVSDTTAPVITVPAAVIEIRTAGPGAGRPTRRGPASRSLRTAIPTRS